MAQAEVLEGGCLCGALRYKLTQPAKSSVHCHCAMCRRASGALVVTWITLPKRAFVVTQGEPAAFRSSDHGERRFCAKCGTPVTFWTSTAPDDIDVNLGSLDQPERYPAKAHVWASAKVEALTIDPDLPSFPEFSS